MANSSSISFDGPSFISAVTPGINQIVASKLHGILDEAMSEVRKQLDAEFAKAIEVSVQRVFDHQWGDKQVRVIVDIKQDKESDNV